MSWRPREQRESRLQAPGAANVGAAPLRSKSRQWLLEYRQLEAAEAAREGGFRSSPERRLPEHREIWLQDQLGTKAAGSLRDGSCGSSSSLQAEAAGEASDTGC